LLQGLLYCCTTMLAIINDEFCCHRNAEPTHKSNVLHVRLEEDLAIDRCCNRRENVVGGVLDHVPGNFRNTRAVECPLRSELCCQLILVEQKHFWNQLE